ncbi:MAG: PEP/pyruvate-binding domain-containing protein [Gammaproteobacteria bacterium]
MVRSDLAASGVIFSLDTETGFRDVVFITGAYGLGENVVQGTVDPDEFYVFKPTFKAGHRAVLRRSLGGKEIKMVYAESAGRDTTRNVSTPKEDQRRFCIGDDEVLQLADAAIKIEAHYSAKAGHPVPMDMEWAKDGIDGKIYLVQARPETVASQKAVNVLEEYELQGKGEAHLSRGHRCARTGGAGGGRLRRCHRIDPNRRGSDRLLRGRRYRPRVCRTHPGEKRAYRSIHSAEAADARDGQHRQSGHCFPSTVTSQRRRWIGTHGIHHRRGHQSASDGTGTP